MFLIYLLPKKYILCNTIQYYYACVKLFKNLKSYFFIILFKK